MSKEPRSSTFSVGQRVEASHSNPKYNQRQGPITEKVGGGVYAVRFAERTRTVAKRTVTDPAETKNFKLGSLQLVAAAQAPDGEPGAAVQGTLFG
ncbi:hypothetical protein [Hymenobacter mucosus]|uniref:Uncharacterized protein n=1 Tax=Hymenobacter mucosus TaxID=1411120 RepID=A0A239A435_9BACT|nr:hypothetical protein [Hymenobacter mucosus]SNR89868.1 hypothetical protein SAMN06269173_110155 [Hymenobacter mucosus]